MHHHSNRFGKLALSVILSLSMVLSGLPDQALAEIVNDDEEAVQAAETEGITAEDAASGQDAAEADTPTATSETPADTAVASSDEAEAPENGVMIIEVESSTQTFTQESDAGADDLFEGYIDARFAEQLPQEDALATQSAADQLEGNDLIAYNALKSMISKVAAGERASTEFEIDPALFTDQTSWTAEDLGVEAIVTGNSIDPDALAAFNAIFAYDSEAVLQALINDLPYDLYWYDKTEGSLMSNARAGATYSDGAFSLYVYAPATVKMIVSSEFADTSGDYLVDTSWGERVSAAVSHAQAIAAAHAGENAYTRLASFRDEICELVDYNYATAEDNTTPYGNPWQLLWVFDNDDTTKVVCEGYAKAFKYLCDLSAPNGVECLLAKGTMSGGTGAGRHMWNIVKMDDGKNYLVDVTNCDAGSIGYPDALFMAIPASGSVAEGYVMQANDEGITYVYDNDMASIYTEDAITLSDTAYQVTASLTDAPTAKDGLVYTGSPQELVSEGSATDGALQYALEDGEFGDAVPAATDAGTYTVRYYVKGDAGFGDTAIQEVSVAIAKAQVATPVAKVLTYTGEEQTAFEENAAYTLSGETSATNAGSYEAVATHADEGNYVWSDGAEGPSRTIAWSIAKADAQVSEAPAALDGLTFTGAEQALVSAGSATGGTMQYALGDAEFGADVPTAVHAGTYTVRYYVKGDANHDDSATAEVSASIAKADVGTATIAKIADTTYTGSAVTPAPKVTWNGAGLVSGTDYTLSYSNNVNVGMATVTITGIGDYTGTREASFTIEKADPAMASEPSALTELVYTGSAQALVSEGSTNDGELQYALGNGAFGADVPTATNAGTYTVRYYVKGDANHNDSDAAEVSVAIAKAQVPVPVGRSLAYTGEPQSGVELGSGYVLSGTSSAFEVGTYKVVATLEDPANYAWADGQDGDSRTITWTITAGPAELNVAPTAKDGLVYTGSPQALVSEGTATGGTLQYALGDGEFGSAVPTATDAGTYTVRYYVKGDANHNDSAKAEVTVAIGKADAQVSEAPAALDALVYTGAEQALVSVGSATGGTVQYTLGDGEFGPAVPTATDAGTYTVRYYVKGDENHNDTEPKSLAVKIAPASLDDAVIDSVAAQTYTGKAIKPSPKVTLDGATLEAGTDYTLSYENNVNAGTGTATATVTITGKGNYTGSKTVEFTIAKAASTIKIAAQTKTYNGKAQAYSGTVTKTGSTGDVTYKYYSDAKCTKQVKAANVKGPGVYYVKATLAADGNHNAATSAAARLTVRFKNVPESHEYFADVHAAAALGFVSGYSKGRVLTGDFGPEDPLTRGQVAVMLWNMSDKPAAKAGAKSFKDVKGTEYYAKAVAWASSVGVVNGYSDGRFGPNDYVQHEQLCVMVANYAAKLGGVKVTGTAAAYKGKAEAGKVSSWAVRSVGWCFRSGLTGGFKGGVYPKASATRAETASMVYRLYLLLNE